MKILLSTFGSHGDINPALALGRELQARGQEVVLATTSNYRDYILRNGLSFVPIRPEPRVDDHALMKEVMDPKRGSETVVRKIVMPSVRDTYQDLEEPASKADLLVSHVLTYPVPVLAEMYGKPWASMVFSPMLFASAYEPPVLAPMPVLSKLRFLGPGFNGWFFRQLKKLSRSWSAPVAALRKDLGLPPGRDPLWEGQHSPHLVLAMFSARFGAPQPDWPDKVKITGFPFLDRIDEPLEQKVDGFLLQGEPPIIFTLGSAAVIADGEFYRTAARVAQRLGKRAVLVAGPHAASLEPSLSASAIALEWASFPGLFSRASVVVHTGGVGTTAQALRAGVPQLVVPFAHDQFDNADRVIRMGCGRVLFRTKVTEKSLARELESLLSSSNYRQIAQREGNLIREEQGAANAAETLLDVFG
jgi:UDP:flavonoid glycosyltransferase YjiC (YdhE family)